MSSINLYRNIRQISILKQNIRCFSANVNVINKWESKFREQNIPEVESSLKEILGHILQTKTLNALDLHTISSSLSNEQKSKFEEFCEQRMARVPVQYILKEKKFRDLTFEMRQPILIPWPETEQLVGIIINNLNPNKPMRMMEIGSGSGAICISILNALPKTNCLAIDQSDIACALTKSNAKRYNCENRLEVLKHELTANSPLEIFGEPFDVILSNPPYMRVKEMNDLEPESKLYEDMRALNGGNDGLNIMKDVLAFASKMLKPNGELWLETNINHPKLIREYLEKSESKLKLKIGNIFKDNNDNDRFVKVVKC